MIGAPALCARAALRGGTGLVKIATTPEVLPHVLTIEPCATGVLLTGDDSAWRQAIEAADPRARAVLAVGPGMGLAEGGGQKVLALLRGPRTVVLDADGLNLLARTGRPRPRSETPVIMTPHPGEFERLAHPLRINISPTDPATRTDAAVQLAQAHHCIVLLKGRNTIVTDGEQVYVNQTGNPALATAGSGDVLTGLIAGLCAQGVDPYEATCMGAYLHGLAGDRWAEAHGRSGLRATDLADALPDLIEQHRDRE